MKRRYIICIVTVAVLGLVSCPICAAEVETIFPKQGSKMVTPPNFTWATGDYDFFVLTVLAPIPGYWYQPIAIPRAKSYFLMPDAWWEAMASDGWGLWFVLGMNTTSWEYSITPWQYFQKVPDCAVDFPDPTFESYMRWWIDKPDGILMASDLMDLVELNIEDEDIVDLGGLEYCFNLRDLFIFPAPISDLSPLAGLVNLESFGSFYNQVNDLSPIAGLINLNLVGIEGSPLIDLRPLANLTNITTLALLEGQITDISPLAGMDDLDWLLLTDNQISEIYPLVESFVLNDGDRLNLSLNPLSAISCSVYIPTLRGWGVDVVHTCP